VCSTGGKYRVLRNHDMPDGAKEIGLVYTPEDAVSLIVAHLPDGCGPAIVGTAEDLHKTTPGQDAHS
ncbi:DUF6193 family natural product biosynthesis protein, partial [Nocardia gipuzkoensis]